MFATGWWKRSGGMALLGAAALNACAGAGRCGEAPANPADVSPVRLLTPEFDARESDATERRRSALAALRRMRQQASFREFQSREGMPSLAPPARPAYVDAVLRQASGTGFGLPLRREARPAGGTPLKVAVDPPPLVPAGREWDADRGFPLNGARLPLPPAAQWLHDIPEQTPPPCE